MQSQPAESLERDLLCIVGYQAEDTYVVEIT